MTLDDETTDVLIGGYLSKDAAEEDYNAVLGCGARLLGAVVVSKDLEGNLTVEQTDHMVAEGAAGLGAVGFAVGLFAPPLLAATAVGAVDRRRGRQAPAPQDRRQARGAGRRDDPDRRRRPDRRLPPRPRRAVESAVTRAVQKAVGEAEGSHVKALKGAIADAQQKMAASGG